VLLTRSPLCPKAPFDLHVLGTPPAFILSQDQTLHTRLTHYLLTSAVFTYYSVVNLHTIHQHPETLSAQAVQTRLSAPPQPCQRFFPISHILVCDIWDILSANSLDRNFSPYSVQENRFSLPTPAVSVVKLACCLLLAVSHQPIGRSIGRNT
jgi:hypothetical protein